MSQTGTEEPASEPAADLERLLQTAIDHHRAGRLTEAETLYRQVLDGDQRHAEALSLLGVLAAQIGDLARGRELVKAAIAQQPQHVGYRFNLARILHMAGDAAAVHVYRETLKLDPHYLPALVNLGTLMLTLERAEEAADCFERARQVDPRSAEAHEGLGFALQKQRRIEDAIETFETVIALDPASVKAQGNLGSLLLEAGRTDDAIARIRQSLQGLGPRPDLHTNLGVALAIAGQLREAVAAFEAALATDPSYTRAIGLKGLVLTELGEDRAAAAIFDYDRLLASTRLTDVPGYESPAAFNAALAEAVLDHIGALQARPGKTMHLGSQTGELLDRGSAPVATLERVVRNAATSYFKFMSTAPGRPFVAPLPADWRPTLRGTVLRPGGFQEPHNHPSGVISGVYYVQLPAAPDDGGEPQQGAIEFGSPPDQIPLTKSPARRRVQPEEGLLLLFPSYFWQRTLPCAGDKPHISIAFDIVVPGRPA